jgi:ribosomal protein L20A (L18A)
VYVAKHTDSRLRALSEVREQVRREYLDAKRREATDKFYKALLSRYSVRIEPPEEKKMARVQ